MRKYEEDDTTIGQTGFAQLKPEGGQASYDSATKVITYPLHVPESTDESYWVEMSIDPKEVYLPDISIIKQSIESHIDCIAFPDDADKDEYIYNLIHKLVGDYISEDMIMRLSA